MGSETIGELDALKLYEDGKQRRYNLLFAVNGGGFAVVQLMNDAGNNVVLGHLTLAQLAVGMIAFTLIMIFDIWKFGEKMREKCSLDAFAEPGKLVLLSLGALIALGWAIAGRLLCSSA